LDDFRRALLEAVDEGFLALGGSVRRALYWHLEDRFSIRRDEIPDRPGEFAEALRDMLGAGAGVLLKVMARRLYEGLGLAFEERPGWGFADYVENAKESVKGV
jgi:hypothetical protein